VIGSIGVVTLVGARRGRDRVLAAWRFAFASTWCACAAVLSVILPVWVRRRPVAGAHAG
jgi:hypothetical protein